MLKSLHVLSFQTPITDTIARLRLGHVARMDNGIPARDALDCDVRRSARNVSIAPVSTLPRELVVICIDFCC